MRHDGIQLTGGRHEDHDVTYLKTVRLTDNGVVTGGTERHICKRADSMHRTLVILALGKLENLQKKNVRVMF